MLYTSMGFFLGGGLTDGVKKFVNAEGLVLDNISMNEGGAKKSSYFLSPILHHNQVYSAENVNILTSWSEVGTLLGLENPII